MDETNPFETRYREYDAWFDSNRNVFESELLAVRAVAPDRRSTSARWVEIGVGSGRFAAALGVPLGVEPAEGVASLARDRGIDVRKGIAEALPFEDASMDAGFLITSLCFIENMHRAFAELARVLVPKGAAVVAFIPLDSPFGRLYASAGQDDPFFRRARLRPRAAVIDGLREAGLSLDRAVHTLTGSPASANERIEPPRNGWEGGSFVAVRAGKRSRKGLENP